MGCVGTKASGSAPCWGVVTGRPGGGQKGTGLAQPHKAPSETGRTCVSHLEKSGVSHGEGHQVYVRQ